MSERMERPEGTDGSDHMYREKVENTYKVLARVRKWAGALMYFSVIFVAARALFSLGGGYLGGLTLNTTSLFITCTHFIAVLLWYLARPGTARESFELVRACGAANLIWFAVLITSSYKYHAMTEPALHADTRLAMYLKAAHGIHGESVDYTLKQLDMGLDVVCFALGCMILANIHPYITIQLNVRKKADEIAAEAKKSSKADDGKAAAGSRRPKRA